MNRATLEQYPGLPRNPLPVLPTNARWTLYEDVTINSRGFALQPHFASPIDSITGRTLDNAIVHLGSWPSYATDKKGHIALRRVRAAHELMLTDMLPPTMFCQ
eukprot:8774880-Karenia_brevis.AAC.1